MHLATIDWILIIAFLVFTICVGLYFTKRAGKDLKSFFLGGRNLPWYIAGVSMVATTFAADTPLGVAGLVADKGISGNWLWWNFLIGGMLTTFFFAKLWRKSEALTEVELVEMRYSGKTAAFLRGFKAIYFGVILNALIVGWVSIAMIKIFEVFFEISHMHAFLATGACIVFVAIYSSASGLIGVVINDILQFFIALGGCIALAIFVVNSPEVGGIENLKAALPAGATDFFPSITAMISSGKTAVTALTIGVGAFLARISMQWWASWYPGNEPAGGGYIAQRMLSTRSEKDSVYATLFFQIANYCIRPWPWIIVGLGVLVIYPNMADKEAAYVMAMRDYLPPGAKGLLIVAFFAAFMSTISTQLNWGASYVVNDFYKRFFYKGDDQKKLIIASRVATIVLMMFTVGVVFLFDDIKGIWDFMIECGAGLGLVLILRWVWWRVNAWSELVASIMSIVTFAISKFVFKMEFPDSFFFIVGVTTLSWLIATFITPADPMGKLASFHKKVSPFGFWGPVRKHLGIGKDSTPVGKLVIAWLCAIAMTYSILFSTGYVIFHEWKPAIIFGGVAVAGLIGLIIMMRDKDITAYWNE